MADVNANIGVNIDTSAALGQLKDLQRQISQFHTSIAKSSEVAALAQRDLQRNFLNSVNSIGAFSAELRTVKTTSESFTTSLEKNKFSMREYFRYAGASTKTFGKLFKSEYDTIGKVAEDRVKKLQTQYIKMGRDASGAMKAIAVIPNELDMKNFATQTQLAAQKQALFNQLMKQGSTNLLNFGKNTQWAGRQLMVGFTLPLMAAGSAASKSFMEMEAQALKFKKVYGDLFTPQAETEQALENVKELAKQFTKYGIAVSDTVGLAADAAAAGFQGIDLQRQTTEATRLSVLGQIDNQQALSTTIALQNAFGISSAELAQNIDFLNAVENQTVVSLDDITTAIPKVAPVIQQLGGDVKDLAFFLTAMKEGGINASEGANALKSGLAALINPTTRARDMLSGLGIDINAIVNNNKGDLKKTVVGFAQALDTLAPLERARAIEQMFGKFQFARLSTLFQNVTKDGTQASRVLKLAGASVQELASLSEQELGKTADSSMNKFKKSVEDLKAAIVPVGEAFLKTVTPIIDFVSKIAEKFSNLSDGTKKAITVMVTVIGGLGPILLMTFGLLANGVANIIKLFLTLRTGYQNLTGQSKNLGEQTQYMTSEQIDAAAAAHSLNQAHATLTQQFTVEAEALQKLIAAYQAATSAAARFATANPGMMVPPTTRKKYASGVVSVPGPKGAGDIVPAMLSPGEAVIPAAMSKKYAPLINGMIAGNIPGYEVGRGIKGFKNATIFLQEALNTEAGGSGNGATMSDVLASLRQSGGAAAAPLLAVIAKDIKKSLNDPNNYDEYSNIGDTLINAAINALESSGKEFVKDLDLEEIVVPAMKNAATELSVAGVEIKGALERAIEQIRTVVPIGIASGSAGGAGRTNLPGSYRATGKDAQEFAMKKNSNVFERRTVPSRSRGTKQVFKMRDVPGERGQLSTDYVTATMAHIMPSVNDSVEAMTNRVSAYIPGAEARINKVAASINATKQDINAAESARAKSQTAPQPFANSPQFERRVDLSGPAQSAARSSGNYRRTHNLIMERIQRDAELTAQKAVEATAKGAGTASPSKKTIPIGEDIARGLEVGMNNRKDDVARSGENLAAGAVAGTRKRRVASRAEGTPASIPMSQASTQLISAPKTAKEITKFGDRLKDTGPKISNMNNAIMGSAFALTSLAGVAQMFGGTLGNISNVVFNLSGALFGLMTITQLMTKQQFLALTVGRATAAKTAMSLVGGSGFTGLLSKASAGLRAFLGPVGLATVVVGGLVAGYKLLDAARKREYERINGLADAIAMTTDQVKLLGDFFSIVPRKLAIDVGPTKDIVGTKTRSAREELKASSAFKEEFAKTIKTLSKSTNQEAQLALTGIAMKLKAQGFAAEQIQVIIDSLREEAGKTNIVLDVKSIDFSEKGISDLKKKTSIEFKKLADAGKKSYDGTWVRSKTTGLYVKKMVPTDEFKKAFATLSGFISNTAISAGTMFRSGEISATQYQNSISSILVSMESLNIVQKRIMMVDLFKKLGVNAVPFLKSLKNTKQEMQVIALLSAGIIDKESNIISNLSSSDKDAQERGRRQLAYAAKGLSVIEETVKKQNEIDKIKENPKGPSADVLSKEAKLTIARLQKELDGLKTKRDLIKESNDELKRQYEYQQKLMQLSQEALQAKISGNYIGAAMIGQQKVFTSTEFNKETASIALDKKITTLENRISELQANAKVSAAEKALLDAKSKGKAMGGIISGPGSGTSDSIPALLSNGEYVIRASSVSKYGQGFFDQLNAQKFADGGMVNASSSFDKIKDKLKSDLIERLKLSPNEIKRRKGKETVEDFKKIAKFLGFADGGLIRGPGSGTSDSIAAKFAGGGLPQLQVSNGEYIVKAKAVQNYGVGFMDAINNQKLGVSSTNTSSAGNTVYNIDMTINGGNQNPSDIADQVIRKLKIETSRNNKSNKVAF